MTMNKLPQIMPKSAENTSAKICAICGKQFLIDESICTQLWEFFPEIPAYPNAGKKSPGKGTR